MGFLIDILILWAIFSVIVGIVNLAYNYALKKFKTKYFMVVFQGDDGFVCTLYITLKNSDYPDKKMLIQWMYDNWDMGDISPSRLVVTNIIELHNKKAYNLINPDISDKEILGYESNLSDEEQMAKDMLDNNDEDLMEYVQNKNEKPN